MYVHIYIYICILMVKTLKGLISDVNFQRSLVPH